MRRSAFALILAVLCAAPLPPARAADIPVDLELILAVDVSRSMDTEELELQREGYVAALTHPDPRAAWSAVAVSVAKPRAVPAVT